MNNKRVTSQLLKKHPKEAKIFIDSLTKNEFEKLKYDWLFWAREEQLPPKDWGQDSKYIWVLRCGRGWGKTRTAVQALLSAVQSGNYKRLSICGATAEEVRDIMIEGESGIKACCPPHIKMEYKPSIKKIIFNDNIIVSIFYGSEPEKSRGAQSEWLWCDEIHKWQYPESTFDNLLLGLRLGKRPLCIVTSTPKPTAFTRRLENLKSIDGSPSCIVTVGSTYSNKDNLSQQFFNTILAKYQGTRLALQELEGQILDDNPLALFRREWIEYNKVNTLPPPALQRRIIIGVDPAITHSKLKSDSTGIIVVMEASSPQSLLLGNTAELQDKTHYYILEDATLIGTPYEWGKRVKFLCDVYSVNAVIVEDNQGGDMTETTLLNAKVTCEIMRVHSSQNKQMRAMNASMLCQQGRIHFYIKNVNNNSLDVLEDELVNWIPGDAKSPDRLDALAHAINFLNSGEREETIEDKKAKEVLQMIFR